nr:MAG TPA: Beta- N-acetylglucosaminidase [Caudoviricetes sp.]
MALNNQNGDTNSGDQDNGSRVRRRLLSINDQIDSIQDASFRNYTRNIEKRFKRLAEQQARMISQTYDQLDREERARARDSLRDQTESMKRSLENWKRYNSRVNDDLTVTEKFATKLFYWNRRRDLRNLEREARYRFKDIEDDAEEMGESMSDIFSKVSESLRDWGTALNVNSLVSGLEDTTQSTRDIRVELQKYSKLSDKQWKEMKQNAIDFSKSTDYAISNIDYLSDTSDIIIKLGIDDTDLAQDMAKITTKFTNMTGVSLDDQSKMLEVSQMNGMGGLDYQKLLSSQMMAIQQADGLWTSGEDLMKVYNDNIDMFRDLSNGNRDLLKSYTESSMALTAAGNSGYIDGLNDQLYEIMNMSLSDIADKMEGGQFYLKDVHDLMQSGSFDKAAKAFIDGYNQMRTQMIQTSGMDGWKEMAKEMDLDGINESQIIEAKNVQDYFNAYQKAMDTINEQTTAQTKFVDEWKPEVTFGTKLANWWKSSKLGSGLDDLLSDLDLSLSEVFLGISAISQVAGLFGKGLGKAGGLLGKLLGGGGSAGGGAGLGSLLSGAGSAIGGNLFALGGNLVELGGAELGVGASSTVAGTAALGAGSVAGGLLGGAGIISGGVDIYHAIRGKNKDGSDMTGKERQDKGFAGGTKIGMVGGGAAAGAAIGSVVPGLGTAVGALIGAGVGGIGALLTGTKVGKALSDAWDWTKDKASDLWDNVSEWGSKTWTNIKTWAGNTWDNVKTKAGDMWDGAKQFGIDAFNTAVGTGDILMENLFSAMGLDWDGFKSKVSEGWENIKEWGSNAWDSISSWASEKWNGLTSTISEGWNSIKEWGTNAWTSISDWAGEKWDGIKEKATTVWTNVKDWASKKWDDISTKASDVWDGISTKASDVWDGVKKGATKAFDAVKDKAGDIWGGIKDFFTGAKSRGEEITGIDGSHKNGLDTVPKDGYIAELHKNEAVLTSGQADQLRAMSNGGSVSGFFHNVWKNAKLDRNALIESYKASMSSGSSSGGGASQGTGGTENYSTGGSQNDYLYEDLGSWSDTTAEKINQWVKSTRSDSPFVGNGNIFMDAARKSGLDPRYILAHAALESAWGTSRIAKDKNNYFGIGAFDSSPYQSAYSFGSGLAAGIIGGAEWISKHYYNGQYNQKSIYKMRHNNGVHEYATSGTWDTSIASIMTHGPANTKLKKLPAYASGTPWVPNDQVALIHKGEMIVPADSNPYNQPTPSASSGSDDGTIDELIQVVKWGVSRIEKAINNSGNQMSYNLANATRARKGSTASDELFSYT